MTRLDGTTNRPMLIMLVAMGISGGLALGATIEHRRHQQASRAEVTLVPATPDPDLAETLASQMTVLRDRTLGIEAQLQRVSDVLTANAQRDARAQESLDRATQAILQAHPEFRPRPTAVPE
jgi:predicted NBD/HSP70 family sugar kinase